MDKLLPCPFCGGEATISDGGYSGEKFLARCRELSCPAASGFIRKTHDEAIAAWNRRADVAPVVRGEWRQGKEFSTYPRVPFISTAYYCSNCEGEAYWDTDYGQQLFGFCPNCGAEMESEDKDE